MPVTEKRRAGRPRAIDQKSSLSTREEILQASVKLFTKHGFKGTTTRMIADEVGIRQPSLFNHFKKKGDILTTLVSEGASAFFEYVDGVDIENGDPGQLLYDLVKFDVSFLLTESLGINQILALPEVKNGDCELLVAQKYEQVLSAYVRVLERGRSSGAFSFSDVKLTATTIVGMVESVWLWFHKGLPCDVERVSSSIADMAISAVSNQNLGNQI